MPRLLRPAAAALVVGATVVSAAWAGVGLSPIGRSGSSDPPATASRRAAPNVPVLTPTQRAALLTAPDGARVGAAKASMYPRPGDYGGVWERDPAKCKTLDPAVVGQLQSNPNGTVDHLAAAGTPWPENPNCIYQGGFSLGPVNPVTEFETDPGLWVRTVAVGDGNDTLILTVIDAEGYLWDYASKCTCGAKQIAEELATELNVPESSFVIAATHSHAAPDLIGGWGFVPGWYMEQISDSIKQTIREAVAGMQPAVLEVGEEDARSFNNERRGTYRSAEEQQLTWLRATNADNQVIATLGAYAAHPTTTGTNSAIAGSDWVGRFEARLEQRFGGIGLHFMTGLGNITASGGTAIGAKLADLLPATGGGTVLTNTDLRMAQRRWSQPTTNVPLDALGVPGFFDRKFVATPSTVSVGKSAAAPCVSASAATVELPATAARIGDMFALTAAPGEVFSNLTNTLKDRSGAKVTMPLAQANDALGYMPQSFEMSPIGQQGLGFVAGGVLIVNYEDSYSVDRCVGDMVLETSISMLNAIR